MIPKASSVFSCFILLLSSLWTPAWAQQTGPAEVVRQNGRTYLRIGGGELPPGRLIVKVHPGRSAAFQHATPGARQLGRNPDLFLVPVPPGLEVREAARRYARLPEVLYAEPDATASLAVDPNDTRWSEQWNMVKIGAPAAWDTQTDSSDVVVAVLDTGINFSHPDLQDNLWTNPVDGSHGFTCFNGTVTPGGLDDYGHGTHVAGIIGAVGNDGLGVAGVNWTVQLLSLKAFNSSGNALISDIVLCIDKLTELKQSGVNIRVSNHSWSTIAFSQALQDALADAESAGVLHVCAAGNSGTDLDFTPVYPAAFDGRGILTVAATDEGDVPASFTSFGHATVDLAAPGVDVLSTVPSGTCTHCDASGYKLLSGTSMATPHVAGVAAALFHRNPALTPAEVRDILLQPASTDPLVLTTHRGYSTTRARLNFLKALSHPWVTSPQLNAFPQLSAPAQFTRAAGSTLTLSAAASDADGDPLTYQWGKLLRSGLYGNMMNQVFAPGWFFPNIVTSNPYSFTVPSPSIPVTLDYRVMVNDGRGGSAAAKAWLNVQANPTPGQAPSGTLTVTPTSGPPGTVVTVSYSGTDPEGGSLLWGYMSGAGSFCCQSTAQTFTHTLTSAGVYRFEAQSIDPELNLSPVSSVVVRIGDAVGEAPVASLTAGVTVGTAPLTVSYDATGSYDPDGGALTFFPFCESLSTQPGLIIIPAGPPTGTCTFDAPGPGRISVRVLDANGYWDYQDVYVMALGSFSPDTQAPVVQVTSPAAGASLSGTVTVNASASDNEVVKRVELYRDSGVLLGTDTTAPYSAVWNTANVIPGPHTLYAKAYDESGNSTTSADVSVTVLDTAVPVVSIASPAQNSQIPNNALATVSVTASDNLGVERVELYRDSGVLLGTDTTAPYTLEWNPATTTLGTHTLYAKAYDAAGNTGTSANVTVSVVDRTPPSVSLTSPAPGSTLPNNAMVTLSASVSDDVGMSKVDFYRDSDILISHDFSAPYSVAWNPVNAVGPHVFYAKAYDSAGNVTISESVSVTVADATPPFVVITGPASGAYPYNNTPITISVDATDAVGMERVELYRDSGVFVATDTTAPYTFDWIPTTSTAGSHNFYAKAYDLAGNSTTSQIRGWSFNDVTPPAVSITGPAEGSTLPNNTPTTISVSASDDVSVTRVDFYFDSGIYLGFDNTAPYSAAWTPGGALGAHTLYAIAIDSSNNTTTSAIVNVTVVDTTPPTASMTSPAEGLTVYNNAATTVSASAWDAVGVTRVEFYRDAGVLIGTDTTAPYSVGWNPATTTVGAHTLYAKAFDAAGNAGTSPAVGITIVDAMPPTVSITSPANGATVAKNTTVTITASASDDVGVTRVDFLVGGSLVCTDTTSPYTCAWRVPKTGGATNYALQAYAYDARNNVGTSSTVVVTAR